MVPEYTGVLRQAGEAGWVGDMIAVHQIACTPDEALAILNRVCIPGLRVRFPKSRLRGYARRFRGQDSISLPMKPGTKVCQLRVGLVLHEAAHVLARRLKGKGQAHNAVFVAEFRKLVQGCPWAQQLNNLTRSGQRTCDLEGNVSMCSDYRGIYERHRGPFSITYVREEKARKKGQEITVEKTARFRGPFSAEEAHEHARMVVEDPRDNITKCFVWSDTEQQFIGAFYERGMPNIPAWDSYPTLKEEPIAEERVELDPVRPEEALVPAGTGQPNDGEPVRVSDDRPAAEPTRNEKPAARPKRSVPAVPSPPRKRGAPLVLGKQDGWPKSAGAQIVYEFFRDPADRRATVQEIVGAIGEHLKGAGVEFPASLVSRLKQAGFLTEAA